MTLFENLKTDNSIANETDNLGGFSPLDSGLYKLTVDLAFITYSDSKAMALNLHFKTDDNKQLRQQFYMTSGTAKGCLNYYTTKDGKKNYLPGFNQANSICQLTIGKEIADAVREDKVINLYDFTAKKEVPTKVIMLTELLGTKIIGGVIKQTVDKRSYNKTTNIYEPTGEKRVENEIDKFFRISDGLTFAEMKAKKNKPGFMPQWEEKWKGQIKDKTTKTKPVIKSGKPKPPSIPGKNAPVEALFT